MHFKTEVLLKELTNITLDVLSKVENYKTFSDEELNWKSSEDSWSVLECIQHLNFYGEYYIPEVKNRMATSKHEASSEFKSGWLGNYFANAMLPKEKLNKMKTFKSTNPIGSELNRTVLDVFINQQQEFLKLLEKARSINLTKTKTSISISKLIKLRLGDTFRVVIYHNLRHIKQADRVLELMKTSKT